MPEGERMDRRSTDLREQGSWLLLIVLVLGDATCRRRRRRLQALSAGSSYGLHIFFGQSVPMNKRAETKRLISQAPHE